MEDATVIELDVTAQEVLDRLVAEQFPRARQAGDFTLDDFRATVERRTGHPITIEAARSRLNREVAVGRLVKEKAAGRNGTITVYHECRSEP